MKNREIRFRAWHKDTNEMFLSPNDMRHLGSWFDANLPGSLSNTDNIDIMQFTGMKDEAGIDIYEGDIIEATERRYFFGSDKGLQTIRFRSTVVYEDAGFIYSTKQENDSPLFSSKGLKVIGNIYEHPHLLTPQS